MIQQFCRITASRRPWTSLLTASRAMSTKVATAEDVEAKLRTKLEATDVVVIDTSGGCGASFDVSIVSPKFAGKNLLARHRLVNVALTEEMQNIHALSMLKCWTPAQQLEADEKEFGKD